MDEADITAERDAAEAPLRLAASRKAVGPLPTGKCHYCGEPVAYYVRWCGCECRDLWQREQPK